MGTHMSRAVRAHDSSQSLRSLNFNKHDNNDSNHSNHSNSNNSSTNSSMKHSKHGERDLMHDDDDSNHRSGGPNISSHLTASVATTRRTSSCRESPEKRIHRNHSLGDIHRLKEAAKSRLPRNLSYGDVRKVRHHHDLHSVSKRFHQALSRSESFREPRETKEVTFRKDFQTHYSCDFSAPLSHGRYAFVTAALSYLTRENVAVKIIRKDRLFDKKSGRRCAGENVRVEVVALKNLMNQPNVVKFLDVFEDEAFFYLVMELCKGGNLLERINKVKRMKEEQAGPLLKQMLAVTSVCHTQGIAHRDLKLENFVFHSDCGDYPLKLVDFGSAAFFKQGQSRPFKGAAGTFNYMAPEVFDGSYGPIADVWSLGVVAYSMLCGTLPFSGPTCEALKETILHDEVEFSHPPWDAVSASAKDLLRKMLEKNPDFRITIGEALSHSWFSERGGGEERNGGVTMTEST